MQRCLRIPRTLHILPKVAKCPPTPIPMAGLDPGTNTLTQLRKLNATSPVRRSALTYFLKGFDQRTWCGQSNR